MASRPPNLNLKSGPGDNNSSDRQPKMPFIRDLPSPRAGEVPPAMSPLDQFAWTSRMMAKQFEEQKKAKGRRISRLDPQTVEQEFRRPDFFRSISDQSKMSDLADVQEEQHSPALSSLGGQFARPSPERERPMSHYPTIDRASMVTDDGIDVPPVPTQYFDAGKEHPSLPSTGNHDYFDIPRATSPEPVEPNVNVQAPSPNVPPSLTSSIDTISSHPRTRTNDSQRSQRSLRSQASDRGLAGLAPPQSPRYPRSPRSFQSIRSVPADSGDEDVQSTGGSQILPLRKFSGSSGLSRPQSPMSPWTQPLHRSPSVTSEYSINGTRQMQRPNPAFSNFSRPMSSQGSRPSFEGRPSLDRRPRPPHRQASGASSSTEESFKPTASRSNSGDDVQEERMSFDRMDDAEIAARHLHGSSTQESYGEQPTTPGGHSNPSYVYAKYALPRGRVVDREATSFRDSWIRNQIQWDKQNADVHSRPQSGHERMRSDFAGSEGLPSPALSEKPRPGRKLEPGASAVRSKSAGPRAVEKSSKAPVTNNHKSSPSVNTNSTDRTVKPTPLHKKSPSAELTPEEHLEIGIEAHDSGATNKSTYHLRLAAMAGLPTAMLLYALACRHGWGMRPNQAEGVKWLRKAIDTAGLDVAEAEEKLNAGKKKLDPIERKKRKAQYALAIYELGISSMNGWGCTKDKALAVRCYEIAGNWGDADALAEAAFCYTQGVGVKKDLHKAASLYRQAADKGMSMAGNSWIYKAKYVENNPYDNNEKKEKPRPTTAKSSKDKDKEVKDASESERGRADGPTGRARSRSIWGKRKGDKQAAPALPT